MRKYKKPVLIECLTYRLTGHSAHDNRPYRPDEEINDWRIKDPIKIAKKNLVKTGVKPRIFEEIEEDIIKIIDNAEKFAKDSKFPVFDNTMQL